jgi:hypothetical protein
VVSIRKELAQAIRDHEALPSTWKVIATQAVPQNPRQPYVFLYQSAVEPSPAAPNQWRLESFTVGLVEPSLDPEKVEDALDDDTEIVMDILESLPIPGLKWSEGKRVTFFDNAFHGFQFNLTVTTEKDA